MSEPEKPHPKKWEGLQKWEAVRIPALIFLLGAFLSFSGFLIAREHSMAPFQKVFASIEGYHFFSWLLLFSGLGFGTFAAILAYSLGNTKRKSIQLEQYLKLARDAMIGVDDKFKILKWNEGAERLYGWKAHEVLGRDGTQFLKTEFPNQEKTAFIKSIQESGYYRGDTIQSHKDGYRIQVEVASIVIRGKDGGISGYLSYNRDIQDRIEINNTLAAARLFKKEVLDAISANLCVVDETGKILLVHKGWETFCDENNPPNLDHQYYLGHNYLQVCDSAEGEGSWFGKQIAQGIRDVMNGKEQNFLMEYPCNSPTEVRWFQGRVTRFQDNIGHIVVAQELITNWKMAKEDLRKLHGLQNTMFESAPYAIIATEVDGTVTRLNAAAVKMTGYTASEVIGKRASKILMDRSEVQQRAKGLTEELGQKIEPGSEVFQINSNLGLVDNHNWTYIQKDGTRIPVRMGLCSLRDPDGKLIGYIGMAIDRSQEVQAQLDLKYAAKSVAIALPELNDQKFPMDQHSLVSFADAQGRITYANELLGKDHRIVNSGYHPKEFFTTMFASPSAGQVWEGEICNRQKDWSLYWFDSTIVPFLDNNGKPK